MTEEKKFIWRISLSLLGLFFVAVILFLTAQLKRLDKMIIMSCSVQIEMPKNTEIRPAKDVEVGTFKINLLPDEFMAKARKAKKTLVTWGNPYAHNAVNIDYWMDVPLSSNIMYHASKVIEYPKTPFYVKITKYEFQEPNTIVFYFAKETDLLRNHLNFAILMLAFTVFFILIIAKIPLITKP